MIYPDLDRTPSAKSANDGKNAILLVLEHHLANSIEVRR